MSPPCRLIDAVTLTDMSVTLTDMSVSVTDMSVSVTASIRRHGGDIRRHYPLQVSRFPGCLRFVGNLETWKPGKRFPGFAAPVAAAGQAIPPGTRPCRLCFVGAASPPLSCSRKPSGPARGRAIRRRPPILLAPCPGAEPPTFYLPPGRGPAPRGDFPAFPQCLLPGALNSRRAQSGGLHPL